MGHVLIAEDDATSLEILCQIVVQSENVPIRARNGFLALEILRENPKLIDIVITDLVMPQMDGRDLIQKIRSDARLKHVPILVQSGYLGVYAISELLEAGATEVLPKPVNAQTLLGYLQHHIGK